ncbi:hypothetical protein P43SY_010092 [Pythium insidiosum]|uniref:Uncharacterized protein n=1 Tax=Pythium insidiosum TaxID=114742 RepID=A0AAD5MFM3_PYTIN|nr:hypothetical protein P43SY_010092 [Pythium insidiosum]
MPPFSMAAVCPSSGATKATCYRRKQPCLRKISAYSGGFVDADCPLPRRHPPKRLSFADQHGHQLALEREYSPLQAPIYCNNLLVFAHHVTYQDADDAAGRWQRLCFSAQYFSWSSPERLALYVASCSLVGCLALGLSHWKTSS